MWDCSGLNRANNIVSDSNCESHCFLRQINQPWKEIFFYQVGEAKMWTA